MKKITAKEAHEVVKNTIRDIDIDNDGRTFYATNEAETEIYCFDSQKERDKFVKAYNRK